MFLGLLLSVALAAPQTLDQVIAAHRQAEATGDAAQFSQVADAWERLLDDPTLDPEQVRVYRAEALFGADRLEEAAEAWEALLDSSRADAAWLRVVQIRGDLVGEAVFNEAPGAPQALDRWLGLLAEGETRSWGSQEVRQAWEAGREGVELIACALLLRTGRFQELAQRSEPLARAGSPAAREMFVRALHETGRTEEAIRLAEQWGEGLAAWATNATLSRAMARAEADPLGAADDLLTWADAHPTDTNAPVALYNAAVLRIEAGDEDGGIALLQRLIRAHPEHDLGDTRLKLASRLVALARLPEALPHLEALAAESVDDALLAGLVALAEGERQRAIAVLQPWREDPRVAKLLTRAEANALVPPVSRAVVEAHERLIRSANAGPAELAAFVDLLDQELPAEGLGPARRAWLKGTAALAVADRLGRHPAAGRGSGLDEGAGPSSLEEAASLREEGLRAMERVARAGALPELMAAAQMELALRDATRDRTLPSPVLPSASWGAPSVGEALSAVRDRPDDLSARVELVRALIADGELLRAASWLQLHEDHPELAVGWALVTQAAGQPGAVPPDLDGELARATRALSALIAGDGMGALESVVEGTTPLARTLEGIAYLEVGAPDAAVLALQRAQGGPEEATLALGLGLAATDEVAALEALGRSTLPEARLAAMVLDPESVKVHPKNRKVLRKDPGLQACGGQAVLVGLVQGGRVERIGFAEGPDHEDLRGCLVGALREVVLPVDGPVVWTTSP